MHRHGVDVGVCQGEGAERDGSRETVRFQTDGVMGGWRVDSRNARTRARERAKKCTWRFAATVRPETRITSPARVQMAAARRERCARRCGRRLGDPFDVGYVNAHATGTSLGDAAEVRALKTVFGAEAIESSAVCTTSARAPPVTCSARAIEAAYTALTLHTGDVHHCGYEEFDPALGISSSPPARVCARALAPPCPTVSVSAARRGLIFARRLSPVTRRGRAMH